MTPCDLPVLPKSARGRYCQRWGLTWHYLFVPSEMCRHILHVAAATRKDYALESRFGRWCEQHTIHFPNAATARRFLAAGL